VTEAVGAEQKVAVAFSGGLDSSILVSCARRHTEVFACTGYTDASGDATRAGAAAMALGVRLVATKLAVEDIANELTKIELPFQPSLMDRSLWCLYSLVAKSAHDSGAKVILLGQLADELFGGYAKYVEALTVQGEESAKSMMQSDAHDYVQRGRIRDVNACSKWVQPRFPFEGKEVFDFALSLPVSYKIRGSTRKAILRSAAIHLGVPEEIAGAPKKAAQYSSGVQKLVASSHF
jgi:asparagine synthase (glutamine-hydrolysing)